MAKAGFCSACNKNVYLTESGECVNGHPTNCITGVYDPDASQAAAPTQAAARPKKPLYKKWWVWVAAFLLLGAIGSALGGGDEVPETASKPTEAAEPAEPKPASDAEPAEEKPAAEPEGADKAKIGDPLKVGDLVFTAKKAGATKELKSVLGNKKGNWIIVTVSIKNNSKEAVTVDTSFFKLIGKDGSTYETDSDNLMYIDSEQSFFLEKINPKLEMTGKALFAVPAGAKPADYTLQVQTGFWGTETGEIALTK